MCMFLINLLQIWIDGERLNRTDCQLMEKDLGKFRMVIVIRTYYKWERMFRGKNNIRVRGFIQKW